MSELIPESIPELPKNLLKQADPILGKLIDQLGDIDQVDISTTDLPTNDLFSAIAKAIISQQISTKAAGTIYERFLALYADSSGLTAQELLDTPADILRSVGISRPKIIYLQDLAQKVLAGLPTIEKLQVMDDETIIRILTEIKGVGIWTVQMFLIFNLHRPDVLPVNDLGIRTAIKKLYQLETLPTQATILELGNSWKPDRSLACRYLWKSLTLQ